VLRSPAAVASLVLFVATMTLWGRNLFEGRGILLGWSTRGMDVGMFCCESRLGLGARGDASGPPGPRFGVYMGDGDDRPMNHEVHAWERLGFAITLPEVTHPRMAWVPFEYGVSAPCWFVAAASLAWPARRWAKGKRERESRGFSITS
jgi:hypothetical protein